jgi:hypothetical protein
MSLLNFNILIFHQVHVEFVSHVKLLFSSLGRTQKLVKKGKLTNTSTGRCARWIQSPSTQSRPTPKHFLTLEIQSPKKNRGNTDSEEMPSLPDSSRAIKS